MPWRFHRSVLLAPLLVAASLEAGCGGKTNQALVTDRPSLADGSEEAPGFSLGNDSRPLAYELFIEADPSESRFEGRIEIDIEVAKAVDTLWLHQREIDILDARYRGEEGERALTVTGSPVDEELLGLRASTSFEPGKGRIILRFRGTFQNIQGFFRQAYEGRWYSYTDFEAIDARSAFPCYDEPRFKVPWTVHVKAPQDQLAFSNAPERAREDDANGGTWFHFEPTPPLPSYLVAFAVGPFDTISSSTARVPLRIIAPKGEANKGRFVLDNSPTWLAYLEEYFGTEVPYPKLDLIAVPHFGGAMENPGLITYSSNILLTGSNASDSEERRAAGVTAHEFAHLWFGDLVTLDHWKNLWLNEGFATWMSDKVVADWQPKRAREVLDIADKTTAFALDHGLEVSPLRSRLRNRDDMKRIFDAITYRKGGAMVDMLEGWLGEEDMQTAMRAFVRAHRHATASPKELIAALESATERDVQALIPAFLDTPGIANFDVRIDCSAGPRLVVRQARQLPVGIDAPEERTPRYLPMCVRYPDAGKSISRCFVVDEMEERFDLGVQQCPAWVHPNDRERGYYHYDLGAAGFKALWDQGQLDPRERWAYLHHLLASVSAKRLGLREALPLLEANYGSTTTYELELMLAFLTEIGESVIGPAERPAYSAYLRKHFGPRLREMGVQERANDTEYVSTMRPVLLTALGLQGADQQLRRAATDAVRTWLQGPTAINPAHLLALLRVAAVDGDDELYRELAQAQRRNDSNALGLVLKAGMYSFSGDEFLQRHMEAMRTTKLHPALVEALAGAVAHSQKPAAWIEVLLSDAEDMRRNSKVPAEHPAFASLALLLGQLCRPAAVEPLEKFDAGTQESDWAIAQLDRCLAFRDAHRLDAQRLFSGSLSTPATR